MQKIHDFFLGSPLASSSHLEHRLPILLALPVFASDAVSSVAYGTQEILMQFGDGTGKFSPMAITSLMGISLAIAVLIVIVAMSYRKAIHLYPAGGGSYTVARDNLGVLPGLMAAAALFIDYILTVAVSISSGVENLVAVVKQLRGTVHIVSWDFSIPVLLSIALVCLIMLVNLRGTKESGWFFAIPAYSFILMLSLALIMTAYRYFTHNWTPPDEAQIAAAQNTVKWVGWLVILKAFSSGCSALTGVEAVSNGISAFEKPEAKNAAKTLMILMVMLVVLFLGLGAAAVYFRALPVEGETVISLVARNSFGGNQLGIFATYALSITTLSILMIAANTSFAGFPRLIAIVAKDGYAPKSFANLGERLVHNQGIFMLAFLSIVLVIAHEAKTNALIPLYAVGVFLCFTLSQFGMAKKAHEMQEKGWRSTMLLNIFGATVTGLVTFVQAISKFSEGAWQVVIFIPLLVTVFYVVHRHYAWFDKVMTVDKDDYNPLAEDPRPSLVLVLISSDIHRGILEGLDCARSFISSRPGSELRAVHVEIDEEKTLRLRQKWTQLVTPYMGNDISLDVIQSPYRFIVEPILEYIDHADLQHINDNVIIVLPEFETGSYFTQLLHNFTANRMRR
ncbi:MAG: APC family permease, partial [bacterium]